MGSSASFSSQGLLSTHSVAGLNIFFMISVLHFYSKKKACELYTLQNNAFSVHVEYDIIDSQIEAHRSVGCNHLISNKCEWNNCFIKNAQSMDKSTQLYFVRTNRMLQCTKTLNFSLTCLHAPTWYNGS